MPKILGLRYQKKPRKSTITLGDFLRKKADNGQLFLRKKWHGYTFLKFSCNTDQCI